MIDSTYGLYTAGMTYDGYDWSYLVKIFTVKVIFNRIQDKPWYLVGVDPKDGFFIISSTKNAKETMKTNRIWITQFLYK